MTTPPGPFPLPRKPDWRAHTDRLLDGPGAALLACPLVLAAFAGLVWLVVLVGGLIWRMMG